MELDYSLSGLRVTQDQPEVSGGHSILSGQGASTRCLRRGGRNVALPQERAAEPLARSSGVTRLLRFGGSSHAPFSLPLNISPCSGYLRRILFAHSRVAFQSKLG